MSLYAWFKQIHTWNFLVRVSLHRWLLRIFVVFFQVPKQLRLHYEQSIAARLKLSRAIAFILWEQYSGALLEYYFGGGYLPFGDVYVEGDLRLFIAEADIVAGAYASAFV